MQAAHGNRSCTSGQQVQEQLEPTCPAARAPGRRWGRRCRSWTRKSCPMRLPRPAHSRPADRWRPWCWRPGSRRTASGSAGVNEEESATLSESECRAMYWVLQVSCPAAHPASISPSSHLQQLAVGHGVSVGLGACRAGGGLHATHDLHPAGTCGFRQLRQLTCVTFHAKKQYVGRCATRSIPAPARSDHSFQPILTSSGCRCQSARPQLRHRHRREQGCTGTRRCKLLPARHRSPRPGWESQSSWQTGTACH